MKLNIKQIEKTLAELESREESKKGMQPEMILSCFLSQNKRDNSACVDCRRYDSCITTIEAYKIDENPFKK